MPANILIVYDREEKGQVIKDMLRSGGDFDLHSAGSGYRAVEISQQTPPDLIFLGNKTRDMDGEEFCRRMRSHPATKDIPLVFYSSRKDTAVKMRAFTAGATDFLVEPFEATELLARVNAHLVRTAPVSAELGRQLEILTETNATKDRLLKTYSRVNRLLGEVLARRGHGKMMDAAMRGALDLTESDAAAVGLYDKTAQRMNYQYFLGLDDGTQSPEPFGVGLALRQAQELYRRRTPIAMNDYSRTGSIAAFKERGVHAFMAVPLGSQEELLGIMCVLRRAVDRPYGDREEEQLWALGPVLSSTVFKANYEKRVAHLVTRDALTDLHNRQFGMETLARFVRRRQTGKSDEPLSLLLVDIDHLHTINHANGYEAGDAALKHVARILAESLPAGAGIAARTGEEFMMVLPGVNPADAARLAEEVRRALSESKANHGGKSFDCKVSIGLSVHEGREDWNAFYGRADRRLHQAIADGGDRAVLE